MGIYLNLGNDGFKESIRSKIYVDKTELIARTNELIGTKEKYICVSRPGVLANPWRSRCLPLITAGAAIQESCS